MTNHLGSVAARMDVTGAMLETYRFLPFGERYAGTQTTHQFTGKERDQESGLDYFGARYLASSHGRWTTVDPVIGSTGDPQRLNRYAYVLNDPVNFMDPDGADPVNIPGMMFGNGFSLPYPTYSTTVTVTASSSGTYFPQSAFSYFYMTQWLQLSGVKSATTIRVDFKRWVKTTMGNGCKEFFAEQGFTPEEISDVVDSVGFWNATNDASTPLLSLGSGTFIGGDKSEVTTVGELFSSFRGWPGAMVLSNAAGHRFNHVIYGGGGNPSNSVVFHEMSHILLKMSDVQFYNSFGEQYRLYKYTGGRLPSFYNLSEDNTNSKYWASISMKKFLLNDCKKGPE